MRRVWLPLLVICLASQLGFGAENTAKDFTLPSATGTALIHLADYAGKVVLINFWRTSCAWSQKESPRLVELYKQYRDKGLVIVGVSDDTGDTVAQVSAYVTRYGITWPVGLNDQGEFQHEVVLQSKAGDRPAGETPGNYIVSRSGQLTYLGLDRGPEAWEKLVAAVKLALDEKIPATSPIPPRKLEAAPPLGLPDLQGQKVTMAAFSGKPLVVNFFTSATCDWTGAVVSKLHQDYAARGLRVVGIDLYDSDDVIRQCTARYGANYMILRGDQAAQMAWIGDNKGWATFFVFPDGKVFKKIVDSINNGIEGPVFSKYAEYLSTTH
jgi:peroxiredoxin